MAEGKSFWSTIQGMLTALAALVTTLGVLIPLLIHLAHGAQPRATPPATPSTGAGAPATPSGAPGTPGATPTDSTGSPLPSGFGTSPPGSSPGGGGTGLTVTPSSLNFGKAVLGGASSESTVTITDPGPGSATIDSIELAGTNASEFAIFGSTCGSGAALDAGASCQVSVRFTASAVGTVTASLNVSFHPGPGSPVMVAITGTVSLL